MSIKTPDVSAYFYEVSVVKLRMLYWIPVNELERLISEEKVYSSVLKDYPNGVDIKLDSDGFEEFKEEYGLKYSCEPFYVWQVFRAIKYQMKKPLPPSGYLRKDVMEDIAQRIEDYLYDTWYSKKNKIKEEMTYDKKDTDKPLKERKKEFRKSYQEDKQYIKLLTKFKIKDIDVDKPIEEQYISKVSMSEGDEPLEVFSTLKTIKKQ